MNLIIAAAMIAQSGRWTYGGFTDEPAAPAAPAWSHAKAAADPPPFKPQADQNIYLEPIPPAPPPPKPPPAPPPQAPPPVAKSEPPPAEKPAMYSLADIDGEKWLHPDPDFLRKWVAERNRTLRPPVPIVRSPPPELPPLYVNPPAFCPPGGG